jgi:dipeptide/tripeptide permease
LDKAAIVIEEDNISTPDLWRLSTVHRVEELKSIIRMGPIWASGILLITAFAQQNTLSLQQAKTMDRHLTKSFQIPAGSMSVFSLLTMLFTTVLYDRVLIRVARRFTGLDRGISFLLRMGIGLVISIFATFISGFIEIKRKKIAMEHGLIEHLNEVIPISVFWLVPQYSLNGMAEAFMSIGHLEFFYDQAPESMRSTAMAFFWTSISIGNYVSTLLVTLVHKFSAGPNGENWLPDNNLNKGKLEYFYWLITILQVINFIYYLFCANMYTYKQIQIHHKEDNSSEDNNIELGATV